MEKTCHRLETKLIHAGEPVPRIGGAVCLPIFQSAMFETAGEDSYHDLRYIRLNNTPNHVAVHRKLAALENGEAALVTASGMAAITASLLTVLVPGDHLLVQDCLYGGTHEFITQDLAALGITHAFLKSDPAKWTDQVTAHTRAVYVETMTNPLLQVIDLEAVVRFARSHGLVSLIDNTFASPINFRPLDLGFDLSLHSATKYLNGHSDIVAGAVIGRDDWIKKITRRLNHLGGSLDPHACFLLHRGMKTLALRMGCHNHNALTLARALETHPAVRQVNYPGLESHPAHATARNLFDGFSGMLSFELHGGVEAAERFMAAVRLPVIAPSLGGVESLVTRPAATSHSGMKRDDRLKLGITDALIRFSAGIEHVQDLIEDFEHALACL